MIKPELSLPIDAPVPAGLIRIRVDHEAGVVDYVFCAGVAPQHARALEAKARAINYEHGRPTREA